MEQEYFQSEIHRLLKLGPDLSKPYQAQVSQSSEAAFNTGAPLDLPIASADELVPKFEQQSLPAEYSTAPNELHTKRDTKKSGNFATNWAAYIVYPFVFAVAFAFFYVVLNFNALMIQVEGWFSKDENEIILEEDLEAYEKWISGYYFSVGDKEKLEPNNDVDFDGLTNLDEFTVKTNPTTSDSDGDGVSDGIEVINNTNPWGTGPMSSKQRKTLEKLDVIKVNNRISFNASSATSLLGQHTQNFDMAKPGRLAIPKLNLQVPIIWTQDPAEFDKDLTRGVVHYPGTALPGEIGTVYVSGHSSDYFWKNHPYKQVFAKINALEPGDDIFVDVYGLDGKIYNFKYRVAKETIYGPADQAQFVDNSGAKLNLSTCWPIGTQKDRYVVTAELQKP